MKPHKARVISDLHLGSDKVARLRGYADAGHYWQELKQAWNGSIKDSSCTIIIAGDVVTRQEHVSLLNELTGAIKIVAGNHDNGIDFGPLPVYAMLESRAGKFILTHLPIHESYFCYGKANWRNIHGHIHSHLLGGPFYNACVEHIGLIPVPIMDLLNAERAKTDKFWA